MTPQDLYTRNIDIFKTLGVEYKECTSEPVLDYETAEKVMRECGLTGTESKSLFIKGKDGRYFMLITIRGEKADFDAIKEVVGTKVSVASQDILKEKTGCEPFCAVPFGFPEEVSIIVDPKIFTTEKYIFSPGPTEKTVEISSADIPKILAYLPNQKFEL